jgi:Cu2+-exporting ATPase
MVARSNHPVSSALAVALGAAQPAAAKRMQLAAASEGVREIPGAGLEWDLEGVVYRLGKEAFAAGRSNGANGAKEAPTVADSATLLTADGLTVAEFRFEEALKTDAATEVERLRRAGYQLHLLSGDAPAKVSAAAKALGIDPDRALGALAPEEKAAVVERLDRNDTLMVGDGINDSPSFEAALCTATPAIDRPVLPGKADFYFSGDGIAALRRALISARRLRTVVRDNLVLASLYNLTAVALCFAGLVTPVVAAILMPLSSVGIVSLTAYRLSGRRLAWMS